jgi:hypothetical protein
METGQMNEDRIEKLLRETKFPNERHKELLRVMIQREELEMSNKAERLKEILADKELAKELAYLETSEAARGWFAEHGLDLTDEEVDEIGMHLGSSSRQISRTWKFSILMNLQTWQAV